MDFRKQHPDLFILLCIFGSFALLTGITFAGMLFHWEAPLAVLWSAAGLGLFYLPTLSMFRWFFRSISIFRKGSAVDAVCLSNHTGSRSEHYLVTWEDAAGTHTEDLGYATLRVRRPPYPVKLWCYAGKYSLGMESVISAGISSLLFLLVQSAILIPILYVFRH
ncbi:MAG: hypothetical protein IJ906_15930 [Oscillospiraceae bacterium]|nr:hypothetical protein [Oscillospiraceae bacterium]